MTAMTFNDQVEKAAKDQIHCECGNADWKQFLFVGAEPTDFIRAGCKKCGTVYLYENGEWRKL